MTLFLSKLIFFGSKIGSYKVVILSSLKIPSLIISFLVSFEGQVTQVILSLHNFQINILIGFNFTLPDILNIILIFRLNNFVTSNGKDVSR